MEYRKFRANNIISIVINYVKRLHSSENAENSEQILFLKTNKKTTTI